MKISLIALLISATALGGCASIINDADQRIRVETATKSGELISGARCVADNGKTAVNFSSGQEVLVSRSNKPLEISCQHDQHSRAQAQVASGTGAGSTTMNFFMGGLVFGTAAQSIDHSRGTAYHYPAWVRLVFGESLSFDRSSEKNGQPVVDKSASGK